MEEESIVIVLWRAIRGFLLLCLSIGAGVTAMYAAVDGKWDKGTFFLIVMIVSDMAFDRAY